MTEETPRPKVSLTRNEALGSRGVAREKLLDSINDGVTGEDDRRAAAVHLLKSRRLVRDDSEMQEVLGCSLSQVRAARERTQQALADNDTLGQYLVSATSTDTGKTAE